MVVPFNAVRRGPLSIGLARLARVERGWIQPANEAGGKRFHDGFGDFAEAPQESPPQRAHGDDAGAGLSRFPWPGLRNNGRGPELSRALYRAPEQAR
jgi:hypothetical protein